MIAKELSDEAGIACLSTTGAGAGELKIGLSKLAELDIIGNEHFFLLRYSRNHVIKDFLLLGLALQRCHLNSTDCALAYADTASHAVKRRYCHAELVLAFALACLDIGELGLGRSCRSFGFCKCEWTDGGVRADESALVALYTD